MQQFFSSFHFLKIKIALGIFFIILCFSRCANIVSPTGGPRDTIPPVLLSATPPDSSLHFKATRIVFNFDEFVQLSNDYSTTLIISPTLKRQPIINVKLRTITILLKDTLQRNTTYQINFGNTIQDINEGNPLRNFYYVFSTGNYLDSLEISGDLKYAETGLPDSNIVVMLYKDLQDSVVRKEKPLYYTRTDSSGKFLFRNLPHGIFKLFALKESDNDLQYDQPSEMIAFAGAPVQLDSNKSNEHLYLFTEPPPPDTTIDTSLKKENKIDTTKAPALAFNALLSSGRQELNAPLILQFNNGVKTIDSAKITLLEDTLNNIVPVHISLDDSVHKMVQINYSWKEDMPYKLLLQQGFATDSSGAATKADTISFKTKRLSEYGAIQLTFNGLDTTKHFVVQLVSSNDEVIYAAPLKGNIWKVNLFNPGTYSIRLLEDENGNGKWDTGQYFGKEKRQPEKVLAVPQKITVRANWDNDSIIKF